MKRIKHGRLWFLVIVYSVLMLCLLALTFTNDEHLAAMFHQFPIYWAIVVHVAIVLLPPTIAVLPSNLEKNLVRIVWMFALFVALIGNTAGNIAYADGAPIRTVLDGIIGVSYGVLSSSVLGSILLVGAEGIIGYLWEKNLGRLLVAMAEDDNSNQNICDNTGETPTQEPRTLLEAMRVPSVPHSLNATIEQPQVDMVTDVVVYSDPLPPAIPTPKPLPLPKPKPSKTARPNISSISNKDRVLAYLNQHGDMTANAIVEALGVPRGTASVYLAKWRSERASVPSMAMGD